MIQYYWQNPDSLADIDKFRLSSLRGSLALWLIFTKLYTDQLPEIEKAIGVSPIETISIHPLKPLYEACSKMVHSRARRIPIIDDDDETRRPMVVSVITQYRILKFVAVNVPETAKLCKPLKDLKIGTFTGLKSAYLETPVMDVIHMLVKRSISSVPIVDRRGTTARK